MLRVDVISSSISSIGYDISERVLEVEFTRGAIYQYKAVPAEEVLGLIFADSVGKFFARCIQKNYQYTQVKG